MPNRYAEDIRRIVGIDDAKKGLPPASDRLLIGASKGIASLTSEGTATISSPGSSTDGTAPAPTTTDPSTDTTSSIYQGGDAGIMGGNTGGSGTAPGFETDDGQNSTDAQERPASFGTGGGGGIKNDAAIKTADQGITHKDAGRFTADELFGNTGPTPGSTITSLPKDGYIGNHLLSGGTLKELVATDCASGKEIRMRTDGLFTPPEATYDDADTQDDTTKVTNEFIDPDTAIDIFAYEAGFVWAISDPFFAGGVIYDYGASTLVPSAKAALDFYNPGLNDYYEVSYSSSIQMIVSGNVVGSIQINKTPCGAAGNPAPYCTVPDPVSLVWPIGGFYDKNTRDSKMTNIVGNSFIVSFSAGKFVPHEQDGNVPTNLSQGGTRADFCWDNDTKFGSMQQTRDGGYAVYQTGTEGGAVDSTAPVRVFDADGLPTGFTDAAGLSAILPNSSNF